MTYTLVAGAAPLAGFDEFYSSLLSGAGTVVAADAAGEWCIALGRTPDVVVGDFDSAAPGAAQRLRASGAEVVAFACDKDETDLDLALGIAMARTVAPVVVTAAFSMRLDHTLAAFGSLVRAGGGASAREPGWRAWICTEERGLDLDLAAGTTFSVLAIGEARGVTITGAQWPLDDAALATLSGWGVSNRASGGLVTVTTSSGTLVVMVQEEVPGTIY